MIANYYHITDGANKTIEPCAEFMKPWQQGAGSYWVDIYAYETDELAAWLEPFNLPAAAVRCCREAGRHTRFFPLRETVFLEFPVYVENAAANVVHVSFLCLPNLVITLHAGPLAIFDNVINGLTSELSLTQADPSALVCLMALLASASSLKKSEVLKKTVFDLDQSMDDNPDGVEADDILAQKRSLRTLDTLVSAQLGCFEFMSSLKLPFLDLVALAAQFQFALSNTRTANQNVDRLEKTIADIRQRFDMNQQEKTNRRLAILTILSAIFMPLTFIAGIYGMNFDNMPELHFPFSYPAVLILMALIAGVMSWYFKIRGWFD